MDLSSRCVRPSSLHSGQVLLDQHGLPTHFSALGLLTKASPRLDDVRLQEAVPPQELNRYYPQTPSTLPIDPMKYRYPGHSSSHSALARGEMSTLLPRHSDRPPFPPYPPGPAMHHHFSAFHAQLGPHSETPPSLSSDVGMHLALLSPPQQRQEDSVGAVNHMPMPTLSHSNLPPISPSSFPVPRTVQLYGLLNTPPPTLPTHSQTSSGGTAATEHSTCSMATLNLNRALPLPTRSQSDFVQRSSLPHGLSDIGPMVMDPVPPNSSSSYQASTPLSKEFYPLSKEYGELNNKSSNEELQCQNNVNVPSRNRDTELLTVDEDGTSSSESSEQSSSDGPPVLNQASDIDPETVPPEAPPVETANAEGVGVDAQVRNSVDTSHESAHESEEDNTETSTLVPYTNNVVFCQVCRKGYGSLLALEKHKESHGPHRCNVCGRSFPRACNLKTHMAVHADRTFFCEECGKSYKSVSSLQIHKNTVHLSPETGNVVCDSCGVVLKNRKSLLQHEQMHTQGKRFSCALCDERFNRKDALNRHIVRIHVEERFFSCQVCGTRCNTNEALQDHMWTHDTERPHECSCCKRRFPQRSALERHMRSHTGVRHLCTVCGTAFTRSYRLKFHMQRHHPTDQTSRNK